MPHTSLELATTTAEVVFANMAISLIVLGMNLVQSLLALSSLSMSIWYQLGLERPRQEARAKSPGRGEKGDRWTASPPNGPQVVPDGSG
ncbi:hypothetical protein FA15DRAFT_711553 [Coprinopsis marcescibilis]|uniref:Uncharacterized protein n=1 Tax=Coprinopsis marcescibilis TaxID=230819 RepID=A0A5C3K9B5_COPMA|nr:hypothetical protein FA15DRAFT_711553 [Coprinopsis marcescibilis]